MKPIPATPTLELYDGERKGKPVPAGRAQYLRLMDGGNGANTDENTRDKPETDGELLAFWGIAALPLAVVEIFLATMTLVGLMLIQEFWQKRSRHPAAASA